SSDAGRRSRSRVATYFAPFDSTMRSKTRVAIQERGRPIPERTFITLIPFVKTSTRMHVKRIYHILMHIWRYLHGADCRRKIGSFNSLYLLRCECFVESGASTVEPKNVARYFFCFFWKSRDS